MIEGKLYLRELSIARNDSASKSWGIVGVLLVPQHYEAERVYPAIIDDKRGFYIDPRSRSVQDADIGFGAGNLDANGLIISTKWACGALPNACELLLRDTELPDAMRGHKWVMVAGASQMHEGSSRLISSYDGKTSTNLADLWIGDGLSGVLRTPIWGAENNPCELSVQLALDCYKSEFARSDPSNEKYHPEYREWKRRMELMMPSKTWYTAAESQQRHINAAQILRELMAGNDEICDHKITQRKTP